MPPRPWIGFLLARFALISAFVALITTAAHAQFDQNTTYDIDYQSYFVTGNATLSGDIYGNNVFVGKNNAVDFTTQPGSYTLTVSDGAFVNGIGAIYPDGHAYEGVNVFARHNVTLTGGYLELTYLRDFSRMTVSGGTANYIEAIGVNTVTITGGNTRYIDMYHSNLLEISGGDIYEVNGNDTSRINISNASIQTVRSNYSSTVTINSGSFYSGFSQAQGTLNIRGGSFQNGIFLETGQVNFLGTELSSVYRGYTTTAPLEGSFDWFTVQGTFGGTATSYEVYIANNSGTGNGILRQTNIAPEPCSLTLLLMGSGITSCAIRRSKRV